jgi:hypothetical protein
LGFVFVLGFGFGFGIGFGILEFIYIQSDASVLQSPGENLPRHAASHSPSPLFGALDVINCACENRFANGLAETQSRHVYDHNDIS